jgi:hypothetical protein
MNAESKRDSKKYEIGPDGLSALKEIARVFELPSRESALQFAMGTVLHLAHKKEAGWTPAVWKDGKTLVLDLEPADAPKRPGGGPIADKSSSAPQVA